MTMGAEMLHILAFVDEKWNATAAHQTTKCRSKKKYYSRVFIICKFDVGVHILDLALKSIKNLKDIYIFFM